MTKHAATCTDTSTHGRVHGFDDALAHMLDSFKRLIVDAPLFTTDASGLWELFLSRIPAARRQHYTCRACKHFVERYGGLVVIDSEGRLRSPLWSVKGRYVDGLDDAFMALGRVVVRAKVTGVFVASTLTLGMPEAGGWTHLHAHVSACHMNRSSVLTAGQAMAEKREEFAMLSRSFGEFSLATVQQAHDLLKSGQLYRGEKCEGAAKWLLDLHERRAAMPSSLRDNVTWLAVADAPPGYCHVRSGMIGTLLADIEGGLPFAEIKQRFDAKMHPLQYLRPQAAPKAGNIAQAERIVEQLRTAGSLARRFARLDDVDALWVPQLPKQRHQHAPPQGASSPVFGHLARLGAEQERRRAHASVLPPVTMTWVKFRDTVLPTAASVEFQVDFDAKPYCAIVTAADADAPPLLQWDREEKRSPASWYLYHGGSRPGAWNLRPGWAKVNAFTLRPCHWYGNEARKEGDGVIAILEGARDVHHHRGGGFFPESLRSEYHAVRRTLEAYAKNATIAGCDEATACGVLLSGSAARWSGITFRVTTTTGTVAVYNLDRWD